MSDEVICLSDTDDEMLINEEPITGRNSNRKNYNKSDSDADFDFPPVNFHYSINKSTNIIQPIEQTNQIVDELDVHETASVDSQYHSQNNEIDYYHVESEVRSSKDNPEKRNSINSPSKNIDTTKRKKVQKTNNSSKDTERARTKENALVEKRLKELERRHCKNIQPGECLKFMTVHLDKDLEDIASYSEIIDVLRSYEILWDYESQPIPNSITWTRKVESYHMNDRNHICEETINQDENQILVIWTSDETVQKIKDETFIPSATSIATMFPEKKMSLIIYGMDDYFERSKKSKKQKSDKNNHKRENSTTDPKISDDDVELCLAEVQLTVGCNSTRVETPQELAMLVYRYTKAIAEIPFKEKKRQKITDKVDWYATGDNRDTVKVDKNGNGLKRLWQQQLCQFNLAGLETAEAICSVYPTPWALMHAYETCSSSEGEKLLKDIPIRRAAGPLSTARKIGPELSKKIFIMFTSENGKETLDNDRVT
ncbi:crossover junction endonuclease EME1 [Venturia canescens]|uniref:crossover junction endonuclease EME1 n=1 Tax=Venturia canescens TaxID=32260 RepID=UPI001C9BEA92|nr:crossover junction endonuclease EME1 [Venturia canescens]XP_043269901.1 crossover junction endonuclease EME1 [Venturia canescens]XP_043269902.1 crossover junction endonuclease EME1 [Venturia canescens]